MDEAEERQRDLPLSFLHLLAYTYRVLLFHAHSLMSLSIIGSFLHNVISKYPLKERLAAFSSLHSSLPKIPLMVSLGIPWDYLRMLFP